MEEQNKNIRLEVVFDSPNYGKVGCLIKIADGGAIAKFSDLRLARDMFNAEKKMGNKNQVFEERRGLLIEKYPGKTGVEIAKEITTKFQQHNIKVKEKK